METITLDDLQSLVTNRVRETLTLDYKSILKLGKVKGDEKQEADRREFLADVCQFANASGGILAFGIAEERGSGEAAALVPLNSLEPAKGPDQLESQILSAVGAGLEPQLYGVKVRVITSGDGHFVLVWVPPSPVAPHRVTYNNKFYIRGSQSKQEMDISMLRSAFNSSHHAKEKFQSLVADRQTSFLSGRLPRARLFSPTQPCWLVHISTLSAMQADLIMDTASLSVICQAFCPS